MNIPERKRARGEMLPLMDVIFMLMVLFIFMLIQMRPDFGMNVELPEIKEGSSAAPQDVSQDKKKIWVSVDGQNRLFVNRDAVARQADVVPAVGRLAGAGGKEEIQIIFKGDQAADFGVVIAVFNELREAGFTDVLFDCNRPEKSGSVN